SERIVYFMVDSENKNKRYRIDTGRLTEDETLEIVRSRLQIILETEVEIQIDLGKFMSGNPMKFTEGIECDESQRIIDLIKKYSCATTKSSMLLQKRHIKIIRDPRDFWENNKALQALMKHFGKIMSLPIEKRRRALIHLEICLCNISAEESSKAREKVLSLREELRRTIDLANKNEDKVNSYREQINYAFEQIDNKNL
ncbi:2033_t:CDS:1, partial [Racocetra fulgida]